MKRSVSSAPRPDATGAPTVPHSGVTTLSSLNNNQNQQVSIQSIRAHESPPSTVAAAAQSTITTYAGILPHGTQIHTATHPNSTAAASSVVHISSANLSQIIRPIASNNPTTIHTIGSNVGINLSALGAAAAAVGGGTPVSNQITIPVSAVAATTSQLTHNAPANVILHRGNSGGGSSANNSRFSTVIPTSLHLNKVSGGATSIANLNQITVNQTATGQIQLSTANHTAANQQVSSGSATVNIATQLVTSAQQSVSVQQQGQTHQIVYSPRVQSQRLIATSQQPTGNYFFTILAQGCY